MKVSQCSNGHFYDADKFSVCPHCGGGNGAENSGNNYGGRNTVSVEDEGVTVSYVDAVQDEVTIAYSPEELDGNSELDQDGNCIANKIDDFFEASKKKYDPVVGWLVCINGAERGRDYRLHAGRNFIGRGIDMDVCVPDDPRMTRSNHASIVFDPRSSRYVVLPGETSYCDVNGVTIDTPVELNDGDRIVCGSSEFCFIGFCREGRKW